MSSAPRAAPSSWNCTPTTPTLSEALAETVTGPVTVAPEVGEVMTTVGGVLSLNTVTVTSGEGHQTPSTSCATALKVWVPLLAGTVFQGIEYGAPLSAAPRLAPSSWNWTRWTVRRPMMLTLASTWVVPPTVEPDVGKVTVTTRLPTSWARAGGGEAHVQARTTARAAERVILAWSVSVLGLLTPGPLIQRRIGIRGPTTIR